MTDHRLPFAPLRLESLPNELFVETFQYLDANGLRPFKGLNHRIDSIIDTLQVNVVVKHQHKDELDYLSTFHPAQIIRLQICNHWPALDLTTLTALRSLTVDYSYLTEQQGEQIVKAHLPVLARLAAENVPYNLHAVLIAQILRGEHFPSLRTCRLKLIYSYDLNLQDNLPANNIVRTLAVDTCSYSQLSVLLHQLPHLRRFETNLESSLSLPTKAVEPHVSLARLQVTLSDPVNDLENILRWMPNLARLRVRGNFGTKDARVVFGKIAETLSVRAPYLQKFDCELYCRAQPGDASDESIRALHPHFKRVRCFVGGNDNWCYATDLEVYPHNNEYEIFYELPIDYPMDFDRSCRCAGYNGWCHSGRQDRFRTECFFSETLNNGFMNTTGSFSSRSHHRRCMHCFF